MFLKSLELNGFKSFASKTVLEFPAGITAIVGPNGVGKSNIVEAIRWLLGEREARNLRGAKIENLIFNGTAKRLRSSLASVGLFFDNGSGFFPIDFREIFIIRRLSRDRNSQYFLNKAEVKLKEIVDFFAKCRLGTKGITVINQGSSDLFVKVSAEERRIIIEEVLGLREFQIKKIEAERKLKNTEINLEKVKATTAEVLPRLKLLKRQVVKWQERTEFTNQLKELEDRYFSFKLTKIKEVEQDLLPQLKKIETELSRKNDELAILERRAKKIEAKSAPRQFERIKNQKNELFNKRLEIQKKLSRLEAKLEILDEADNSVGMVFNKEKLLVLIKDIKAQLEKTLIFKEFPKMTEAIRKIILEITEFLKCCEATSPEGYQKSEGFNELSLLQQSKNALLKEIDSVENQFKNLSLSETETISEVAEFNKNFQKAFGEIENKREEIRGLNSRKQEILFEREKLNLQFQELKNQLQAIDRKIEEFQQHPEELNIDLNEAEKKIFKLRQILAQIGEIDQSLVKEAETTEKHYQFLADQIADLEKASADLKILIKELKEKINSEFKSAFRLINEKFNHFFRLMFLGGSAKLKIQHYDDQEKSEAPPQDAVWDGEEKLGVEIELKLPNKKLSSLEMLSGGEKSLVSIAALFALISVSPPPFLVLDEIDAALDEKNSQRFASLIKDFSRQTQFIIVTHNRAVMEAADVLYGVTMDDDGTSKVLSLKLDPHT